MATFAELESAAPSIAAFFRERIEATGLSLVATTRSDGWPRVSAWEAFLCDGGLYMGSMPNAVKAKDLRRDPRCCIITPLADKDDLAGEAKLFCRAREIDDADEWERVRKTFLDLRGFDMGDFGGSPPLHLRHRGRRLAARRGRRLAHQQLDRRRAACASECAAARSASRDLTICVTSPLERLSGQRRVAWWSLNLSTPSRKPSAKIVWRPSSSSMARASSLAEAEAGVDALAVVHDTEPRERRDLAGHARRRWPAPRRRARPGSRSPCARPPRRRSRGR